MDRLIRDYIKKYNKRPSTLFVPHTRRFDLLEEVKGLMGYPHSNSDEGCPKVLGMDVVWVVRDNEVGVGSVDWVRYD